MTKLGGLVVGLNEMLLRANTETPRLAFAALMMMGAQVSEGVALSFIDRMLGRSAPSKGE